MQRFVLAAASALAFALSGAVLADGDEDYNHKPEAQDFIHGAPEVPSEAWTLAAGGRIYDNWWSALDRDEPEGTNPAYPIGVNTEQTGEGTWRCKECHGWDYLGKDGIYAKGSHFTGIKGINGAIGKPVQDIAMTLRDANHPYSTEMISDEEMLRVAAFVSRGQVDMRSFLDFETRTVNTGNVQRGREIFQTTCAACHGPEGKGNPILGAPNLTDDTWLYGSDFATISEGIRNGRNGMMPAHGPIIGETRSRLVGAYVWTLSHGKDAEPPDAP